MQFRFSKGASHAIPKQRNQPLHNSPAPCYSFPVKISGTYRFDAAPERVWDALLDPEVVRDCIPGVQDFAAVTPDSYRVEVGVKVGVFSGSLTGTLEIFDKQPITSYRMGVRGAGPMTNLAGDALVSLADDGDATTVTVDGDVTVTGALARVGQRFISSAAKSQFDHFFGRLSEKVAQGES